MNSYFHAHFPRTVKRFGPPLLFGAIPNHECMAGAMAESPARLVFYEVEDRFYFWDRVCEAYAPVLPEERLFPLMRAIIRRSLKEARPELARAVWLVWNERELRRAVEAAKAVLGTAHGFFAGETGMKRFIDGRIVEPAESPSYRLFAEEMVEAKSGSVLTSSEAYHGYWAFCQPKSFTPLRRAAFKERFTNETLTRFGVGMRHDLVVQRDPDEKPRICQGWMGLTLKSEPGLN